MDGSYIANKIKKMCFGLIIKKFLISVKSKKYIYISSQ